MGHDELVCTCMEVSKSQVEIAIKKKGLKTVEEVSKETGAGTICGGCIPRIQELLDIANKKAAK